MFESLTQRLSGTIERLRGRGRLTEENIREATREVRIALLEADVALPVVQALVERIRRLVPDDAPLLIAGDFNDWGQQIKRMLAGYFLYEFDAPRTFTYPARLPLAQLDHVYVRGLDPISLTVPQGRIWWRMSDHLPLIAEFKL